jgi:adenine phosphoribosyltransferase
MELIKTVIREVPDFPKPGILFYDITTLLADPDAFSKVIDRLEARGRELGVEAVVGMESRGFIFGTPVALRLGVPFIPVRKAGKLPWKTESASYSLEYGEATIEIHQDALKPGQKTLIVDDLLATGGTAEATIGLVERLGAVVSMCMFVIELGFLEGRAKLPEGKVESLIIYDE